MEYFAYLEKLGQVQDQEHELCSSDFLGFARCISAHSSPCQGRHIVQPLSTYGKTYVPACVRWREKALRAPKRDCAQRSALWAIASVV